MENEWNHDGHMFFFNVFEEPEPGESVAKRHKTTKTRLR